MLLAIQIFVVIILSSCLVIVRHKQRTPVATTSALQRSEGDNMSWDQCKVEDRFYSNSGSWRMYGKDRWNTL